LAGVRVRCLVTRPPLKSRHDRIAVYCDHVAELDMRTLVWTRGERFPLDQFASRLKCPKCGNRKIIVVFVFDVPQPTGHKPRGAVRLRQGGALQHFLGARPYLRRARRALVVTVPLWPSTSIILRSRTSVFRNNVIHK
jgi:hypothetical protein